VPQSPLATPPLPHGRTARRLTWEYLPPDLRHNVEQHLGSRVVRAVSCDAGFTPGFASVLTGADGSTLFLKAASRIAQATFAKSYAEEARIVQLLGTSVPAPRLRFVEDDAWLVLGYEAIDGHTPARPWHLDELTRALDLAEEIAAATVQLPAGLGLRPLTEDLPRLVTGWEYVALVDPDRPHLAEATQLAQSFAQLPADRFVHADLRDDNILLATDGRTLACDWNWPALAPAWIDLVVLLISAYGDGLDAEAHLSSRALTHDVPAEHIDAWLAALCGFMLESGAQPLPRNSPYLHHHADWYAEASWSWLSARRGW
jgi:aminoglycoside phosphotransferase (APT) family kinase protein